MKVLLQTEQCFKEQMIRMDIEPITKDNKDDDHSDRVRSDLSRKDLVKNQEYCYQRDGKKDED